MRRCKRYVTVWPKLAIVLSLLCILHISFLHLHIPLQPFQVSSSGDVVTLDLIFLSGNTIRYVHIPKEYPIVKHLSLYMKTIERVSVRGPRKIVDRKKKENDDIPDC